jgi:nicotinamide riboside transporter PnuC
MREIMITWLGSIFGIIGSLLLALNFDLSKYGYVFFLLSGIFLAIIFTKEKNYAMILQQSIFTIINSIGIYNWII